MHHLFPVKGGQHFVSPWRQLVYREGFDVRIDDPIRANAKMRIKVCLNFLIADSRTWRQDFDNQVRRPLHMGFRHNREPIGPNEKHIGFGDSEIIKDHIERSGISLTISPVFHPLEKGDESPYATLMRAIGRWAHDKISCENFITFPVIWQLRYVTVSQKGTNAVHRESPLHTEYTMEESFYAPLASPPSGGKLGHPQLTMTHFTQPTCKRQKISQYPRNAS